MLSVMYQNKLSTLVFHGAPGQELVLKSVVGLGLPPYESQVASFAGRSGQHFLGGRDLPRVIGLSFDLWAKENLAQRLSQVLTILHEPGELSLSTEAGCRRIACRCTNVEEPERKSREIYSVVVEFTCDEPYFCEKDGASEQLYHRVDLVCGAMELPQVFTESSSRKNVMNEGHVPTEPVISVSVAPINLPQALGAEDITIVNHTTGKSLVLDYALLAGEVILIDIPGRKIESSLFGDITDKISETSFLSDFALALGENDLEVICDMSAEGLSVVANFDILYLEAVI